MTDPSLFDLQSIRALVQEATARAGLRSDLMIVPPWQGWWSQIVFLGDDAVIKIHKEPDGNTDPHPYENFLLEQEVLEILKGKRLSVSVPDLLFKGARFYGMTRLRGKPLKAVGGLEGQKTLHQVSKLANGDWFIDPIAAFIVEFDRVASENGVIPQNRRSQPAPDPLADLPAYAEELKPLIKASMRIEQMVLSAAPLRFTHTDLSVMNILIDEAPAIEQSHIGIVDFGLVFHTDPHRQFCALLPCLGLDKCTQLINKINAISSEQGDPFNLDPTLVLARQVINLAVRIIESECGDESVISAFENFAGKLQRWFLQSAIDLKQDARRTIRFRQ
jgi:hypothetical protein